MSCGTLAQKPEITPHWAGYPSGDRAATISATVRRQDWEQRRQGYPEHPSGKFFPVANHRSMRGLRTQPIFG